MAHAVTVIIPTHRRTSSLLRVLKALATQQPSPLHTAPQATTDATTATATPNTIPLFEVVVVVDGDQGDLPSLVETLDLPYPMRVLCQAHAGPAAARNLGAANAKGDLLFFLDDDVVPAPHWFSAHLALHEASNEPQAIFGPMWSPPDVELQPWVAWEQAQLAAKYARLATGHLLPNPHQFYSGNASVRRVDLLGVGGFDETLWRSEDVELAYRLAGAHVSFSFAEQADSYHYAERSYAAWLATPYTYGRNSVMLAENKGHHAYLDTVLQGFAGHHPLLKVLLVFCLGRPWLSRVVLSLLKRVALSASRLQLVQLGQFAFSALYNLCRYQGMADALGGRDVFYRRLSG